MIRFYGAKLDKTLANGVLNDGDLSNILKYGMKCINWGIVWVYHERIAPGV